MILTMGTLAKLEAAFGTRTMLEFGQRVASPGFADTMTLIAELSAGAVTIAELESLPISEMTTLAESVGGAIDEAFGGGNAGAGEASPTPTPASLGANGCEPASAG